VNVLERLPASEQWTHWYKGGRRNERARQLDYLLVGRQLDERAGRPAPAVYRKGLPRRAAEYQGERIPEVGEDDPKASDHCPLYVDIPVAALAPAN
jgi:exonuclease III